MSKLVEKRTELDAKRASLAEVFEAAGTDIDFNKPDVLAKLGAKDSAEAVEKVRAANKEIESLYNECKSLADVENIKNSLSREVPEVRGGVRHGEPDRGPQSLGEIIVNSSAFQTYRETKNPTTCEAGNFGLREVRAALFQTTAGHPPESVRSGRIVDAVTRPLQVIDILPIGTTSQAAYVYMEETTRTHAAEEKGEGVAFAESAFALTERSSAVRKITDSVPVTDEQLEDVEGVEAYLNGRLMFGLRQRFDTQVLTGNGTAPNLRGILNVAGIQTQAKGADPVPDAIYKALTKVRVTGRAAPTHVLLHPNDWQDIRLMRTADGIYIWGSPSEAGAARIWGLPVVQADALTENTGLVGAFDPAMISAFERRGIDIQVGYSGTQFVEGRRTIRADMRVALVVFRPAAFATVTGI
jgi:HK97 family phage major capsid protein